MDKNLTTQDRLQRRAQGNRTQRARNAGRPADVSARRPGGDAHSAGPDQNAGGGRLQHVELDELTGFTRRERSGPGERLIDSMNNIENTADKNARKDNTEAAINDKAERTADASANANANANADENNGFQPLGQDQEEIRQPRGRAGGSVIRNIDGPDDIDYSMGARGAGGAGQARGAYPQRPAPGDGRRQKQDNGRGQQQDNSRGPQQDEIQRPPQFGGANYYDENETHMRAGGAAAPRRPAGAGTGAGGGAYRQNGGSAPRRANGGGGGGGNGNGGGYPPRRAGGGGGNGGGNRGSYPPQRVNGNVTRRPAGGGRSGVGGGNGAGRPRKKAKRSLLTTIINIALITLSAAVIVAIVMLYRSSTAVLSNGDVYSGVQVNGEDVSGMTYEELVDYLDEKFGGSLDGKFITIKIGGVTEKYSFKELGVRYDAEAAARQAYDVGRSGSGINRMQKISDIEKNPVNLSLAYTYDREKVNALADRVAREAGVLSEDAEVEYTPASVIIKPGREGVRVNKDALAEQLQTALDSFQSAEIEVELIKSPPEKLNADKIFETIYKEPADAFYKVSSDHKSVVVETDRPGQTVDRDKLIRAVESLNSSASSEVTIPLLKVDAAVKKADLSGQLFQDKLGGASTNFSVNSTNNKNRRDNMTLATKIITGHILAPGEEFEFNNTVGKRTEANGYKMAGAFMNGQLIDDVGGGICQVSSTLYNAVLYADLAVTQRQNHSYLVGYVTKGFDATVSYPLPDFKFKNNTKHPIRIDCGVDGTTISFSIYGTQTGPQKKITFFSEIRDSIEFKKITSEDPTLPVGTTNISQAGRVGYTIDSYKTVQIGDGPKETIKIATNKYKAMDQIETIGTMPLPPNAEATETVIGPSEEDSDYVSDAGLTQQPDGGGQSGTAGGEETTTRPLRTPRPPRDASQDENAATTEAATDRSTTERATRQSSGRTTTTKAAQDGNTSGGSGDGGGGETETTTKAARTTKARTTAAQTEAGSGDGDGGGGGGDNSGGSGDGGSGDGGGAAADAPKRTPRPQRSNS